MPTPTTDEAAEYQHRRRRQLVVLGVLLIALGVSIGYQVWQARRLAVKPYVRKPSSFLVRWRCLECGHTIQDRAGRGPRDCPKCGRPSLYVSIYWSCPPHGTWDVAFQYDEKENPIEIKIGDAAWVPLVNQDGQQALVCPICGVDLMPAENPPEAPRAGAP